MVSQELKEGNPVSERFGQTVIIAQQRAESDYIVARSKNGVTHSETFPDPEKAAERFNEYKEREV